MTDPAQPVPFIVPPDDPATPTAPQAVPFVVPPDDPAPAGAASPQAPAAAAPFVVPPDDPAASPASAPQAGAGQPQQPTSALPPEYPPGYQPTWLDRADDTIGAIPHAIGAGLWRGVFETKDFLTGGETPEDQRSSLRQEADATVQNEGTALGLVSGISQFSIGMLGLRQLKVAEGLKAAAVGAAAFDPHEGNLANIVQSVPALTNPVTGFLATKEGDSEYLDRAKKALVSIGVDKAASVLFSKALAAYKALHGGDEAAQAAAHDDLQSAHAKYNAPPPAANENEGLAPGKGATNDNTPNPSMPVPTLSPQEQAEYNLQWAAREADARDAAQQPQAASSQPAEHGEAPQVKTNIQYTVGDNPAAPTADASPRSGYQLSNTGLAADLRTVESTTQAGAPQKLPLVTPEIGDGQIKSLLETAREDTAALMDHGTWQNAIDAGHIFGDGGQEGKPDAGKSNVGLAAKAGVGLWR